MLSEQAGLTDAEPSSQGIEQRFSDCLRPSRILIAEDEHLVAVSLAESLQGMGFEVIGPTANGQQAIELAKQHHPDLALLDIRMPVMDGLCAASILFGQMHIPVVILSAFSDPDYLKTCTRIGVFGYMLKPASTEELCVGISVAWCNYLRHAHLCGEIQNLKTSLENRKIIEKAKGLLMQRLSLSEDEAMKRLQKRARDTRQRLVDLARGVLEADELLGEKS